MQFRCNKLIETTRTNTRVKLFSEGQFGLFIFALKNVCPKEGLTQLGPKKMLAHKVWVLWDLTCPNLTCPYLNSLDLLFRYIKLPYTQKLDFWRQA